MNEEKTATIPAEIWDIFKDLPNTDEIVAEDEPIDLESDPEFVADYLKARFVEDILKTLDKKGMKRSDLARAMGKSRQYVGRILNERANFTLETLAEVSCALGMRVAARMYPKGHHVAIVPIREKVFTIPPFLRGLPPGKVQVSIAKEVELPDAGNFAA